MQINKMQQYVYFFSNLLNKIVLQRSEETKVQLHSNLCSLELEIFVFRDETGFIRVFSIFDDYGLVKDNEK